MMIDIEEVSVSEIMTRWPDTMAVFIRHNMFCIGCAIAPFHTVAEACTAHALDAVIICTDLNRVIAASGRDPAQ